MEPPPAQNVEDGHCCSQAWVQPPLGGLLQASEAELLEDLDTSQPTSLQASGLHTTPEPPLAPLAPQRLAP